MKKLAISLLLFCCVGVSNAHILSYYDISTHPCRVPLNIEVNQNPSYERTSVEQSLIDQYVAVMKTPWVKNLLFVVDDQDRVALYDTDGNQLIPFLEGMPRVIRGYGNYVLMGDKCTGQEWESFFDEVRASNAGTKKNIVGNGVALYSIDAKKVLIQPGEYDYITCAFKYPTMFFYVAKYDDNDELKWGLYSTKKQLLPCEYNYVTHVPKAMGDNSKNMLEEFDKDRIVLAAKQAKRQRVMEKMQVAAQVLGGVGNAMISAGSAVQATQQSSSVSSNNSQQSSGSSVSISNDSKNFNTTDKNADARTYSDYESQLIQMNTYYADKYNDQTRRNIQSKMKAIRQKWEQRGFQMFHSTWEDWDGIKK